jgi:hypothetical protein
MNMTGLEFHWNILTDGLIDAFKRLDLNEAQREEMLDDVQDFADWYEIESAGSSYFYLHTDRREWHKRFIGDEMRKKIVKETFHRWQKKLSGDSRELDSWREMVRDTITSYRTKRMRAYRSKGFTDWHLNALQLAGCEDWLIDRMIIDNGATPYELEHIFREADGWKELKEKERIRDEKSRGIALLQTYRLRINQPCY